MLESSTADKQAAGRDTCLRLHPVNGIKDSISVSATISDAESNRQVCVLPAEARLTAFFDHVKAIDSENASLHLECMKLVTNIKTVQEDHLEMLQSLKQFGTALEENEDGDDEAEGRGSRSLLQLPAIVPPFLHPSAKNYISKFATYLEEVQNQNSDLQTKRDELQKELEGRKATLSKLSEDYKTWKVEYDEFMIRHKKLTEEARAAIKP